MKKADKSILSSYRKREIFGPTIQASKGIMIYKTKWRVTQGFVNIPDIEEIFNMANTSELNCMGKSLKDLIPENV